MINQWIYRLEHKLAHNFWFLPPDIHERQRWIGKHIPHNQETLDLGGEERHLEKLTKSKRFVTLNVDPSIAHNEIDLKDHAVYYDGNTIPFSSDSFDYVVCIDVLEHVPQNKRIGLIAEMSRVSREKVIISAPFGTIGHQHHEQQLYHHLKKQGHDVKFLHEHIAIGLPKPKEIKSWQQKFSGKNVTTGNYRFSSWLLTINLKKFSHPWMNHLWFFTKSALYLTINLFGYRCIDLFTPEKQKNRFYFIFSAALS